MAERTVTDTGPPLHLVEIDQEALLCAFTSVNATSLVRDELSRWRVLARLESALGDRLAIHEIGEADVQAAAGVESLPEFSAADQSVLMLCARIQPDAVLCDDQALRRALERRGFATVGTVGILIRAFQDGLCDRESLRSHTLRLFATSTLHLSAGFRSYVLGLVDTL